MIIPSVTSRTELNETIERQDSSILTFKPHDYDSRFIPLVLILYTASGGLWKKKINLSRQDPFNDRRFCSVNSLEWEK